MPDPLAPVLESLLQALDQMQRATTARRFRQEFASRRWHGLTIEDQRRVLDALAPDFVEPPPKPTFSYPPPLAPFTPFLDALPDAPSLLQATAHLSRARTWETLVEAVDKLFIDVLGYDPHRYDRSSGLLGRSQIEAIQVRARHGDLEIAAVRLSTSLANTRWANASTHYTRCFKLLPYALLISFEPGTGAVRLVYPQRDATKGMRPRYRCLSGPWFFRDPADDLLSFAWRFHLLRPQSASEAGGKLIASVQDTLERSAGSLADEWASAVVDAHAPPPGLSLSRATTQLTDSFLQHGVLEAQRLHWGLQAALDHAFPLSLQHGRARLACEGYRLGEDPPDLWTIWRRGGTRAIVIHLQLRIVSWSEGAPDEIFEVACSLPIPDEDGRFLVEGQLLAFRPELSADGRLVSASEAEDEDEVEEVDDESTPRFTGAATNDDDDVLDDDDDEPEVIDALDDVLDDEEQPNESAPDAEAPRGGEAVEGVRVDRLLSRLVDRRLAQIGRRIRGGLRRAERRTGEDPTPGDVLAALSVLLNETDRLSLLSTSLLSTYLVPIEPDAPTRTYPRSAADLSPPAPPAWACPELSAALEPGEWAPIAGARVHPMGSLAVITDDPRGPRLASTARASAFTLNPRFSTQGIGRPEDWIADGLEPFAHLPVGTLPVPARFARGATPMAISRGARVEGLARPRAHIKRRHALRWQRRRLAFDIPAFPGVEGAPKLCITEGATTQEGTPWVHVPRSLLHWHEAPPEPAIARLFQRALSQVRVEEALLLEQDLVQLRLPWAGHGLVLAVGVEPRVGRYGLRIGWRAWIEVALRLKDGGLVVDEDGSISPLEWTSPENLPVQPNGEPLDLALPLTTVPAEHDIAFCAETGEACAAVSVTQAWWIPPILPLPLDSGRFRRRLLLDGEQAPAASERPGLGSVHHRWWVLADPIMAAAVTSEAEGARRLAPVVDLASAGAVPPPRALVPEPWLEPPLVEIVDTVNDVIPRAARLHSMRGDGKSLHAQRCVCGSLGGATLAGAHCPTCATKIQLRPSPRTVPLRARLLPFPVLHPWRFDLAGALLGLTENELHQLLDAWGPVALLPVLAEHAARPCEAGLQRLTLPRNHTRSLKGTPRRALGLAVDELHHLRTQDSWFETLWLDRIVFPPDSRMPAGLLAGAGGPVASPLHARIHQLIGALRAHELLSRSVWEGARRSGVIAIQHAVSALFGPSDSRPDPSTIAGLLTRSWGPTRPDLPRIAWRALGAAVGPATLEPEPEDLKMQGHGPATCRWADTTRGVHHLLLKAAPVFWILGWAKQAGLSRHRPMPMLRHALSRLGLATLLSFMQRHHLEWATTRIHPGMTQSDLADCSDGKLRALIAGKPLTSVPASAANGETVVQRLVPTVTEACTDRPSWVLQLPDQLVPIPSRQLPGSARDPRWWMERAARERMVGRWLVPLCAALSRLDDPAHHPTEIPALAWQKLDAPMGWLAVIAAARAMLDPDVSAANLLDLLEGTARPLPADPEKAVATLLDRLDPALPGDSPCRRALRSALAVTWAGWWRGPPDANHPSGLAWLPPGVAGPSGWRRTLLPLDHIAWRAWPEMMAATSPARFLAHSADAPLPPPLRLLFGLPVELPPGLIAVLQAEPWPEPDRPCEHAPPTAHRAGVAVPFGPVATRVDHETSTATRGTVGTNELPSFDSHIRVLTGPLLAWIRRGAS